MKREIADDFVVSGKWVVPEPLDKYLAAISIRNTSNDLSNFNVVLNANFGCSTILIEVDDTTMEVDCELKQAEVRLYYSSNCSIDFGKGYAEHRAQKQSVLEQRLAVSSELAAAIGAEGRIDPEQLSGLVKLAASAEGKRQSQSILHNTQTLAAFNHIQLDTVSIQGDPLNPVLSGPEVVEYEGWAGSPTSRDTKVGVGASLLVREEWINFSNAVITRPGRLGSRIQSIFQSAKSRKAEQFKILLAYLTRRSLQDPNEKQYATLACSAFVLEPVLDSLNYLGVDQDREKLSFHPALIEQFTDLPEGRHEAFVRDLIADEADPTVAYYQSNLRPEPRIAAPKGTVFEALRALTMLVELPLDFDFSSGFLQENIPKNTRQDLSNLGLLIASKGRSIDAIKRVGSASINEALLYSASQTKWFVFAANFLEEEGIRTPSKEVGRAVSDEFDLGWADSSKKRNGQNIKKWVAVLYPMFADLWKGHRDFFYVQSLTAESDGKGANPIFTQEFIEEIEFLKLQGQSYSDITEHYGVSPAAFSNWKRRNKEAARRAKDAADRRQSSMR
jgi:hypothetical protein